jgi:phosphonate transport system substrate-binding protein
MEEQIRSIYKSGTFPTAAFGSVYNLEPSLAAKVREAFFSYVLGWYRSGAGVFST